MKSQKLKLSPLELHVYIFKTFSSRIAFKESILSNRFTVLIINSGAVCLLVNNVKIHLFVNELIVIPKKSICEIVIMSHQLQISQLSFSSEFAFVNSIRWPHIGYFTFFISQNISKIFLKNKEINSLIDVLKIINNKYKKTNINILEKQTLLLSFNLFLYELAGTYYRSSWRTKVKHTRSEKIIIDFFRLVELNCRKEHTVKFYADTLHISTGHLTKIVKEITEITAKQCITNAIILEAKVLLQNNNLTILTITDELQFASTSFFSTFFKKQTSLSPSEYRSRLNLK
ncbi:MAG: AraC family transcriptional regulator [Flavobacteriaceae bacterium]|nr:AraC family transcriptional regulator [Flavobacteriaceae bacterium]